MSDNWTWFFGWATVAAFILAVPLAVIANILTPRVQRWWGTTALSRARHRASKLQAEIGALENFSNEDALGKTAVAVVAAITAAIGVLLFCVLLIIGNDLITAQLNGWKLIPAPFLNDYFGDPEKFKYILYVASIPLWIYNWKCGLSLGRARYFAQSISPSARRHRIAQLEGELSKLRSLYSAIEEPAANGSSR